MGAEAFHRPGQKTFGPWGNHTSSLDWCEDNYTHLAHVAEFWNTLSNIPFILLGVWGMLSTQGLPNRARYMLAHSFLSIIGVGSFVFHGTLKWHAQVMLDELPMIWSAAVFMYLVLVGSKERGSTSLKLTVMAIPAAISWLYLRFPDPVIHQVAYASMQVVSMYHVRKLFQALPVATQEQRRQRDECRMHFWKGAGTFLLGFAIWNVDNLFCNGLTSLRSSHGELIGALTQGHAWWHLLTGLGASRMVTSLTYLTLASRGTDEFKFAYTLGHPYVSRKESADVKKSS